MPLTVLCNFFRVKSDEYIALTDLVAILKFYPL